MPSSTGKTSRRRLTTRQKNADQVISRRSIRALLRRDGRRDEITQAGFNLLTLIGSETMKQLVMSGKTEMSHTLGARGVNTTINAQVMKHAANCLGIPGAITEEASTILNSKAYNSRAMRRSATKRLVSNHGGKKRCRSDVAPFLYCIAMVVIDEIVSQVQQIRGGKNVRIKNEHIYSVINSDDNKLLSAPHLKEMVGAGMSFV